jgi:hypothetical protein
MMRRMRESATHDIEWRRRVVAFDVDQRRPQRFLWIYAAFFVGFWIATFFLFLFDVLGADGREPLEQPIREFIFQAICGHGLAVSTGVTLALTIAWWKFVSPGPRRNVAIP